MDFLPDNPFTVGIGFIVEAIVWTPTRSTVIRTRVDEPDGPFLRELAAAPSIGGRLGAGVEPQPDESLVAAMTDAASTASAAPTTWSFRARAAGTGSGRGRGSPACASAARSRRQSPCRERDVVVNFFAQPEAVEFLARGVRGEPRARQSTPRVLSTARERCGGAPFAGARSRTQAPTRARASLPQRRWRS
jgi:hypothetical protein